MKWVKASEQSPPIGVIKRNIQSKLVIPNDFIKRQTEGTLELNSIHATRLQEGFIIPFADIEWLDESEGSQNQTAKRTIESIQLNEVVHCPTLEEATVFCNLLHEAGKKWKTGNSFNEGIKKRWDIHKEQTCYDVHSGKYQSLDYSKMQNNKITNVSEFLKYVKERGKEEKIIEPIATNKQEFEKKMDVLCARYYKDKEYFTHNFIDDIYKLLLESKLAVEPTKTTIEKQIKQKNNLTEYMKWAEEKGLGQVQIQISTLMHFVEYLDHLDENVRTKNEN